MAVPAHDKRDFEFAHKFGLKIRIVIQPKDFPPLNPEHMKEWVPAMGEMVNSGHMSGTPGDIAFVKVLEYLENNNIGKRAVNYGIRDWLISRQRYWGAPIPVIYCQNCGVVPVPDKDLPVLLPDNVEWKPTGESPLKLHPTWRFTTCPTCGRKAERETDTMDTFMCSSWYHLRYLSPQFNQWPFKQDEYDYWMPVDTYTGGAEHSTMHLIYTRFFHKACRDLGIVKGDEPMLQLRNQGQILGPDGQRMSKSRGNIVDPDEQVRLYGADTVRSFLMFGYRWSEGGPWETGNIQGVNRWLNRVWNILLEDGEKVKPSIEVEKNLRRKLHQTLLSVTRDYRNFEFNTIVSGLMELINFMNEAKNAGAWGTSVWNEATDIYIRMLAPIAPHIAEEIWQLARKKYSVHLQPWPQVDETAIKEDEITLVIQINGKVRDRIIVSVNISEDEAKSKALENQIVQKFLEGKSPQKVIYIQGKLVNIVK
jgi:leucyl-tRNA synthetase